MKSGGRHLRPTIERRAAGQPEWRVQSGASELRIRGGGGIIRMESVESSDENREINRFDSLSAALQAKRIPIENHESTRRLTSLIEVAAYFETSADIKAVRARNGPDLRIAYGWSNGSTSADEVLSVLPEADVWPSGSGHDLWGYSHPVGGHGNPGAGLARTRELD